MGQVEKRLASDQRRSRSTHVTPSGEPATLARVRDHHGATSEECSWESQPAAGQTGTPGSQAGRLTPVAARLEPRGFEKGQIRWARIRMAALGQARSASSCDRFPLLRAVAFGLATGPSPCCRHGFPGAVPVRQRRGRRGARAHRSA